MASSYHAGAAQTWKDVKNGRSDKQSLAMSAYCQCNVMSRYWENTIPYDSHASAHVTFMLREIDKEISPWQHVQMTISKAASFPLHVL